MLLFYFLYHIRRVLARVSRPTHGYLPVCCPPLGSVNLSNSPSMSSLASLPSFRPQESAPESLPPAASSCRISRLPSLPSIPHAGPSRSAQRYLYFGVRQGFLSGVYTDCIFALEPSRTCAKDIFNQTRCRGLRLWLERGRQTFVT